MLTFLIFFGNSSYFRKPTKRTWICDSFEFLISANLKTFASGACTASHFFRVWVKGLEAVQIQTTKDVHFSKVILSEVQTKNM